MRRLREVELKAATYKADRMATWKERGEIPRLRKPTPSRERRRKKGVGLLRSCLRQAGGMTVGCFGVKRRARYWVATCPETYWLLC